MIESTLKSPRTYYEKYLMSLSQVQLELNTFKKHLKSLSPHEKIQLLRMKSRFKYPVFQSNSNKINNYISWMKSWKKCFVCIVNKAQVIHPIMQIQKNSYNDECNLISICDDCNKKIND